MFVIKSLCSSSEICKLTKLTLNPEDILNSTSFTTEIVNLNSLEQEGTFGLFILIYTEPKVTAFFSRLLQQFFLWITITGIFPTMYKHYLFKWRFHYDICILSISGDFFEFLGSQNPFFWYCMMVLKWSLWR